MSLRALRPSTDDVVLAGTFRRRPVRVAIISAVAIFALSLATVCARGCSCSRRRCPILLLSSAIRPFCCRPFARRRSLLSVTPRVSICRRLGVRHGRWRSSRRCLFGRFAPPRPLRHLLAFDMLHLDIHARLPRHPLHHRRLELLHCRAEVHLPLHAVLRLGHLVQPHEERGGRLRQRELLGVGVHLKGTVGAALDLHHQLAHARRRPAEPDVLLLLASRGDVDLQVIFVQRKERCRLEKLLVLGRLLALDLVHDAQPALELERHHALG
mmetsp:Transcript_6721/g.27414  ORF Transcript_6721/g.27414 Transcript_6721/m.27414 type:complete len:269 (-) Transcript_6721:1003-1809(-)